MQSLLLLHGAIGSKDQLEPLAQQLNSNYQIHTLNFPGHGGAPFPSQPFSIQFFSDYVLNYLSANKIKSTHIFGYSMGGYVAMYLAKHHPEKISKIITLATKFHWDEMISQKEVTMLNAETIESKIPAFASELHARHAPNNWKQVLDRTKEMLIELGNNNTLKADDYNSIETACMIMLGDKDKMVTLGETVNVFRQLKNGGLSVLPFTTHPLEKVNLHLLCTLIKNFLTGK